MVSIGYFTIMLEAVVYLKIDDNSPLLGYNKASPTEKFAGSSKGRTSRSGRENWGSSPCPAAKRQQHIFA